MNTTKKAQVQERQPHFPAFEKMQQELGKVNSMDDFFGKDGIFAKLFANTIETMLEAELEQLGYERYAAQGRTSGNSRNGKQPKQPVNDNYTYAHINDNYICPQKWGAD